MTANSVAVTFAVATLVASCRPEDDVVAEVLGRCLEGCFGGDEYDGNGHSLTQDSDSSTRLYAFERAVPNVGEATD